MDDPPTNNGTWYDRLQDEQAASGKPIPPRTTRARLPQRARRGARSSLGLALGFLIAGVFALVFSRFAALNDSSLQTIQIVGFTLIVLGILGFCASIGDLWSRRF